MSVGTWPLGLMVVLAGSSMAQSMPGEAEIQAELLRRESERKTLFAPAAQESGSWAGLAVPEPSGVDVQALAREYAQRVRVSRRSDELMVFASFSLPEGSLRRIVQQAYEAGAVVLLRGFKNDSLMETAQAVRSLHAHSGHVMVNPEAFSRYDIEVVPTVVLASAVAPTLAPVQGGLEGCALPDSFVALAGDVSLDYALEEVVRRAPSFAVSAARYLDRMRQRE